MATSLIDFLTPLKTLNVQVVVKNMEQENICKIFADNITTLDEKLAVRTVNRWDIIRNNLLNVYLNNDETPEEVQVTGIEISNTTLSLYVGESATLVATILPLDATNKNVSWISTDSNIITVENGIVSAIAEGSASIVVTTEDGGYTATCEVTVEVVVPVINVESIELVQHSLALPLGQEATELEYIITPLDATDTSVTWSSSNESIATVDNGFVTPLAEGTAIITVTTVDGGFTDVCAVTVSIPVVQVESVELNLSEITISLKNLDFSTLVATVNPENATYDEIIWTSSDETIVTVENGTLTPIAEGTASIIATVNGVESSPCLVTVIDE